MDINYFTFTSATGEEIEMVNILNPDGSTTQMPKAVYDAQQAAAYSTESVTP